MRMRGAIAAAVLLLVCLPAGVACGQQKSVSRPAQAPRTAGAGQGSSARSNAGSRMQRGPTRQQSAPAFRATPVNPGPAPRPVYPTPGQGLPAGSVPRAQVYAGGNASTNPAQSPTRPAYRYPGVFPPGHLGSWLQQHKGLPVQQQEQMLRSDPSFRQLGPVAQQRLVQQLRQVDQLPAEQRERRLARAETIEHLTPQQRMQVNQASQSFSGLAPDRQVLVRRAFRDLRSVPQDQRGTVLNSARYQGVFTPDERNILSGFLLAEPYAPQQ